MKAEGGKVKVYADQEEPSVKAMWEEEFFGHELPRNYKISRIGTPQGLKKDTPDGRGDVMGDRAMWDEEFPGHRLPPNYDISRFRTSQQLEKKGAGGRLEAKDSGAQQLDNPNGQIKLNTEDTIEYNFARTLDNDYVLSEEISGSCKDVWSMVKPDGPFTLPTMKVETFEERALRFGVEDWNLVGNKKWPLNGCKGRKRSVRRGDFCSPSGSDTSSMISTLESSSFSCGSEGSSFAKTDFSSSSFSLAHVYVMSGGAIPLYAVCHDSSGLTVERTAGEEQFVELNTSDGDKSEGENIPLKCTEPKDGISYFEFNFLDGKMVESEDADGEEGKCGNGQMKSDESIRPAVLSLQTTAPYASVYQAAEAAQSPESQNFLDRFHDSDWSNTQSASTIGHGCAYGRGADPADFDEDKTSYLTQYRACEYWSSDSHFYVSDPFVTPLHRPSTSRSKDHMQVLSDAEGKGLRQENSQAELDSASPAAKALASEDVINSRSAKKLGQGTPRKTRSLGSVLSHHLAFTAVPSLRYVPQPSLTPEQESPARVTAACMEWLWSDKNATKPVQSLRALAERENVEREKIGSSRRGRNLDSASRESRTIGLGRAQPYGNNWAPAVDTLPKKVECSASSAPKDSANESRDSILASWAAVYGAGDWRAAKAKQSFTTTKVSLTPSSSKQYPKRGILRRKGSISFGPQTGSKAASSLSKHPVPKSLALELEVLCRPFGTVLKGVRFLPTAKRGLGRPRLFSNLGPQLASNSSSSSITLPAVLKCGRLQCVVSRDGLPCYSLIMDETEEIFVAKRVDAGAQEGLSHMYSFHSFKDKGKKGKTGWGQWGKRNKSGTDFAGNMTVVSTICPVLSSNSVQNVVESEFVLFDAKMKEISISGPTPTSPHPRSSFSSWDTVTPQRSSPGSSSTYSSPSTTYFSLPSPTGASCAPGPASGAATTPSKTVPSRCASVTLPGGVSARGSTGVDNGFSRFKQLERHFSPTNFLYPTVKSNTFGSRDSLSDSEIIDDYESRTWARLAQFKSELAAVVVRAPLEIAQGKTATVGDKWGWGISFLRKSFHGTRGGSSPEQSGGAAGDSPVSKDGARVNARASGHLSGIGSIETCNNCTNQLCSACRIAGDEHSHGVLNVTLIVPSGEHGCSANGIDGPQPLIERWRSGGKCDCGSWDLGCGLTTVGNQRVDSVDTQLGRGQSPDSSSLRLYIEGKKQQTVGLALTPLMEGCYSLGFQAPISPLHAFATAVALLHSRDPIIAVKKAAETRKRLTRIPVKVVQASARSFSGLTDGPSESSSFVSYKVVCPDPPSSPFGRA